MKRYGLIFIFTTLLLSGCATPVVTPAPTAPSNVVIVKKAPRNHRIVVIKGKRYYTWNGNHYRKTGNGYVLVKVR